MRIILDTNILLSGLLVAASQPARLLDAWERQIFTLVACQALIDELREVSGRPFFRARLEASKVDRLLADIADFSMFITSIPITSFLDDPKDGFLLGLAEAAGADYLVTGDKALLGLQRYGTTAIISATDMLRILIQSNEK